MISIENKEVTYNNEYYVLRHFASYVGSGSVRLGLSGMFSGMAAAFETKDGKTVIMVMNPIEKEFILQLRVYGKSYKAQLQPDSINTIIID